MRFSRAGRALFVPPVILITALNLMLPARNEAAPQGGEASGPIATETDQGLSVTTLDTLYGRVVVNLPDDLSAGDTISGTVETEPKAKDPADAARNQDVLNGFVVELGDSRTPAEQGATTFRVPARPSTTIPLIVRDKGGKEVARTEIPVKPQEGSPLPGPNPGKASALPGLKQPNTLRVATAALPAAGRPGGFELPSRAQPGHPLEIRGPFDGDFKTTKVRVGGADTKVLAESPRKAVALSPRGVVGPAEVEVVKRGVVVARGTVRSIGVKLAAGNLNLKGGETTSLTVTVSGLEGLVEPVALKLVNQSPTVVTLGGGVTQVLTIDPRDAPKGQAVLSRTITGIHPGGFGVAATVDTGLRSGNAASPAGVPATGLPTNLRPGASSPRPGSGLNVPPSLSNAAGQPSPSRLPPPACDGAFDDFESGFNWQTTGTAFRPVSGDLNVRDLNPPGFQASIASSIGGSYWNTRYPNGHQGDSWVWSGPDGNAATGSMTSPEFLIQDSFIDFLMGGGDAHTSVALEIEGGAGTGFIDQWRRLASVVGDGIATMRRVSLPPIPATLRGHRARFVVTDDSPTASIAVDDFECSNERREVPHPVWGFADLHTHPAANLGFGGNLYVGSPIGPIEQALQSCESHHGKSATDEWFGPATGAGVTIENIVPAAFLVLADPLTTLGTIGVVALTQSVNLLKSMLYEIDGPLHSGVGYPALMTYRYYNALHQHMYQDWIRRAYDGGLRLMVAHPVSTALLANLDPKARPPLDDKGSADKQLALIKELVAANSTWMEIAYTPAQARDIVQRNKLCVILGMEIDDIGDLPPGQVTSAQLNAELDRLYAEGVRHIFPIHLANSPFGGMAIYNDMFDLNNIFLTGQTVDVIDGRDHGIQFRLGLTDFPGGVPVHVDFNNHSHWDATILHGAFAAHTAAMLRAKSHRNAMGLTDVGKLGIGHLMDLGMIIDIDHMSDKAINETLALCAARHLGNEVHGYPVVSGHSDFRDLAHRWGDLVDPGQVANEAQKSRSVAEQVIALGGMFAPITDQSDRTQAPGWPVADDAPGTSKSFAQNFQYAVSISGTQGVGIGTDMALLGGMGPRFGTDAAPLETLPDDIGPRTAQTYTVDGGMQDVTDAMRDQKLALRRADARAQANGVTYDSPIRDYRRYRFFWTYGNTARPIYTERQRDFWEALAIWASGTRPDQAEQPGIAENRSPNTHNVVVAFAEGLSTEDPATLVRPVAGFGKGDYFVERRAAFLLRHPGQFGRGPGSESGGEEQGVNEALRNLREPVWNVWTQMLGTSAPIHRLVYSGTVNGRPYVRDFDFNIDGLAHYGMLPDMLQDLQNIGLTDRHMVSLFSSTETYLRVWERAWKLKTAPPSR